MALKESNKNRKKVVTEALLDTDVETHETTISAVKELADINNKITVANTKWILTGVTIGVLLLLSIL